VAALRRRGSVYRNSVVPLPGRYRRLRHGDTLEIGGRRWRVITGTGHSPEMSCLYCHADRLLLAGDQILPRISPHVGVWGMEPEADPLRDYLDSLERFRVLPDEVQVLPSHGEPFPGPRERCAELGDHHARRLDETLAACRSPATAAEVSAVLFRGRDFDLHQSVFALGEAVAHLNHLVGQGRLTRTLRPDGVWRFAAS
jgi:glyoxylase-like metal-dependent hydrolase (beta-lactamase superfamily II)